MTLSCTCATTGDGFFNESHEGYCNLSTKCYGCGDRLSIGDEVLVFYEAEYGDGVHEPEEIVVGYSQVCGTCRDIYWALRELGYCLYLAPGFIKQAHEDYKEMTA